MVTTDTAETIADGLATTRPTEANVAALRVLGVEMMLVTEDEMLDAMRWLAANERVVAEPAGAAPVAAILQAPRTFTGPVVALITGSNVAPDVSGVLNGLSRKS